MALFQSDTKDLLKRLDRKEFASSEERDELLKRVEATDTIRARDVMWMLFRPDRAFRDTVVRILQRTRDPETLDLFISEAKGKPETAVRAASGIILGLNLPGVDTRLVSMIRTGEKEAAEIARRLVLDAPITPTLAPVLWEIAGAGALETRMSALQKLAPLEVDAAALQRWGKLAHDADKQIRERALETLAQRAPMQSIDLLVEQLPNVSYSTQQVLVQAMSAASATGGLAFARRLLPLMASGEAATRTAVLKILVSMPNPREVIKEYIVFSKTFAGWARERALESMRAFGPTLLEPAIELLSDPDEEVRSAAIVVAESFEDPRIVPAVVPLIRDADWWVRISAVETLGRLKDPRAVEPIISVLGDPEVRWSAIEALGRIGDPRALPALGKLLSDPEVDMRIEVLQALKEFQHPQVFEAMKKVAATDPSRAVRARALDMVNEIAARTKVDVADADKLRAAALNATSTQGEPKLHSFLIATRNQGASDFHLTVGQPPIVRLASELLRANAEPFTPEATEAILREVLEPAQWTRLEQEQQLDFCYFIPSAGRYRANVFIDQKGFNAVFRVIPEKPPTITELGLPSQIAEIADYHQGLVLICGPSGSGKSTTLAALVNLFNETRRDHVITMEDPVEFVHPFKNCLINQREVGKSTASFARALRAALREDPDVIVIGEMRDNETVSLALTAAETGHIVLGTLNSTSAPKAIDRIISSFSADEQAQIRTALSESLKYVIAQRLLPAKEGRKQVACYEILKSTSSIANLIRDEKTFQIISAMQIGRSQGMLTVDDSLRDLVKRNQISAETAYLHAAKKEDFEPMVSPEFLKSQAY